MSNLRTRVSTFALKHPVVNGIVINTTIAVVSYVATVVILDALTQTESE